MAKKSKEVQSRGMWEFPPRKPEDRTATARIIERLKNPQEAKIGNGRFTNISTSGSVRDFNNGTMASIPTDKPTTGDD